MAVPTTGPPRPSWPLAGLVLPAVLIPIIAWTGYSEWVEETAKALVVAFLVLRVSVTAWRVGTALVFGFLFGLSETALYAAQAFQAGMGESVSARLATTVPMHMLTALVIAVPGLWGKKFVPVGWIAAVGLHILFNRLAA